MNIKITQDLNENKWLDFVEDHPNGNIFHTPYMFKVFQRTKNYKPYIFASVDYKTGEIFSLLLSVHILTSKKIPNKLSSRFVIYGGVLHKKNAPKNTFSDLIKAHDNFAKNKCLFTEFRNKNNINNIRKKIMQEGYTFEEELNYLIDLNKTTDEIFATFSSKKRRCIRKAIRKGVIVEEILDKNLIPVFYSHLKKTYKRVNVPLVDKSHFENIFKMSKNVKIAKFFIARKNDIYLGSMVILIYKGVVYAWYGGADQNYFSFYPYESFIWHAIKWGAENGYKIFDFGGAGNPNKKYGVRDFKARFRGKQVNYGRYIKVYRPLFLKISKIGYWIYRKFLL